METKIECRFCGNSGIYYAPDGDDDFTAQYCICAEGAKAEGTGIGEVVGL